MRKAALRIAFLHVSGMPKPCAKGTIQRQVVVRVICCSVYLTDRIAATRCLSLQRTREMGLPTTGSSGDDPQQTSAVAGVSVKVGSPIGENAIKSDQEFRGRTDIGWLSGREPRQYPTAILSHAAPQKAAVSAARSAFRASAIVLLLL